MNLKDLERSLNRRGKKDASMLGKLLKKKKIKPQLIISSPAKRAQKTARKIANELHYKKADIEISEILYKGKVPEMVNLIRSINQKYDHVFLVGHYPGLMNLGNYLTNSHLETFKTSGFILIKFNPQLWETMEENSGEIVVYHRVK